MLIGLGDYGVLWVARYDECRQSGEPVAEALRHTALRHPAPAPITKHASPNTYLLLSHCNGSTG